MSGGGQSGKVGFPEHMETIHKDWFDYGSSGHDLPTSIADVMDNALGLGGDPYLDYSYDDPSDDMDEVDTAITSFKDKVGDLNYGDDWSGIVDDVISKIDEDGVLKNVDTDGIVSALKEQNEEALTDAINFAVSNIDEEILDDLVKQFDRRSAYAKSRSIRQFTGQMADINAVQSSAFLFGLALIESEHIQSVNEFNKEITKQSYDQMIQQYLTFLTNRIEQEIQVKMNEKQIRDQIVGNNIQLVLTQMNQEVTYEQQIAQLIGELKRLKFVINQEYVSNSADLDAMSATWDFKVYEYGVSYLGGIGGGTRLPDRPSKAASAIGGALSGAGAGAMQGAAIGAAGGPIGATGGAALGALMGVGSALL